MLELRKITSGYDDVKIIKELSLNLKQGSITTIIGSNGVGKTTAIRTISGINKTWTGQILFEGKPIHDLPPHKRVEMGIVMVPEGRRLFPSLTVRENLQLGAFNKAAEARVGQMARFCYYCAGAPLPGFTTRGARGGGGNFRLRGKSSKKHTLKSDQFRLAHPQLLACTAVALR